MLGKLWGYILNNKTSVGVVVVFAVVNTIIWMVKSTPEVKTEYVIVENTKTIVVEKKVEVARQKNTNKVVKKPDGTIITTTTTDNIITKIDESKKDTTTTKVTDSTQTTALSRYFLGVSYITPYSLEVSYKNIQINFGARLGNTPFFLTGHIKTDRIGLGVQYSF